jgi:signal transduction histidine kinase
MDITLQKNEKLVHLNDFILHVTQKADRLMNYFLVSFFLGGLMLAFFYDTWLVAICVGGLSLIAYYSAKAILPGSNLYQYVLSAILGIFMAQYIYQMHGLFEMHFIAFISSTLLIMYQNWKLQIPITIIVVIHHAIFGYLQYTGLEEIYFTKLNYMDLQTFMIHIFLAGVIFFICGLWAYQLKMSNKKQIEQSIEIGRLQEAEEQKIILSKSNEELLKSNTELDKFVYSVSHDLRAPLSSMLGVVALTEEETEEPIILKHLGLLKGSIHKLDGFIEDILNYSRNSRLEAEKEEIDFHELLEEISTNLRFMGTTDRKVEVKFNIDNSTYFISDKGRLDIILNNLISNGIRYQNPDVQDPFVNITINASEEKAHIKVSDNGIGIAREYHQEIFNMFYRVSKKSVGSGLGLYIVKETVNKLQGNIEVRSEPGKGTEFHIEIPNLKNNVVIQ